MAISKYKTKSGEPRYKATIWRENRAVLSQSFRRKVDADEWFKRESVKVEDDKVGRLKGTNITLADFFETVYFPNSGVRESTSKDYLRMFNTYCSFSLS